MKVNMREKDKKLLIFLSIFVVVVCIGYWGIYPVIKDISEINTQIIEEEDKKFINDMKLSELPIYEEENVQLEKDILVERDRFFPMMEPDELDDYVTNMALDYGLFAYNLNVTVDSKEASLPAYKYSQKVLAPAEEDEESGEDSSAMGDLTEMLESITTGIYTARVSVRLDGDEEILMQLIDDLSKTTEKIRIQSYSWGEKREIVYGDDFEDFDVVVSSVLNLNLEFYMCEE